MSGNLSQHNLGLNQDDVRLLRENVSLVIHTGVTDYKATLIDAIKVNLLGTLEVINICCQIKNLKVRLDINFE
jgi:alcohol-forming fatty acyl-CoA reductase